MHADTAEWQIFFLQLSPLGEAKATVERTCEARPSKPIEVIRYAALVITVCATATKKVTQCRANKLPRHKGIQTNPEVLRQKAPPPPLRYNVHHRRASRCKSRRSRRDGRADGDGPTPGPRVP